MELLTVTPPNNSTQPPALRAAADAERGWHTNEHSMKFTIRPLTPDLWKQGVMSALIGAALKTAKRAHAPALEAYPVDTAQPGSTTNIFTGTASAFRRLGFKTVARREPSRPIMRHDLRGIAG
jgi:hypothetical protein